MMIPDDVGMIAFHGDAKRKATLMERLQWYEAQGGTSLKMAMLQEQWSERAQSGPVMNPYPKIARREDSAGLRLSGDVATLYALGTVKQSRLHLVGEDPDGRIYVVQYAVNRDFSEVLGIPTPLVSLLRAISKGLTPERETSWLGQFWAAVPVGASLWRVPMRLILWALADPSSGILGLNNAAMPVGESDRGIKAVHDFLALYENWSAGNRTEPPEWFSFVNPAEGDVKSSRRQGSDGEYVYDLPAPVRCCLRAAASAARTAMVEEKVVSPLPKGTIKLQILDDNLDAPGDAIYQAGLYASERGIIPSDWYETCASVLLAILADGPVPDRTRG